MSDTETQRPDFRELESRIVAELRTAIETLTEWSPDDPLAAFVLWADPYKGWYEVYVDTAARNAEGAQARNAQMLELLPRLADEPDAWKTAMSTARQTQALPFDPRYGEFATCDEPVHDFELSLNAFVRSPLYATLNVGGEDGWLEGHMRFVVARALARLVAEGAFEGVPRAPSLYVGYAYPDSSDAIIVAIA